MLINNNNVKNNSNKNVSKIITDYNKYNNKNDNIDSQNNNYA